MERAAPLLSYFDNQANRYDQRSARGLWKWIRAREQLAVLQGMGSVSGFRVLELGCGSGYYSEIMSRAGAEIIGVDSSAAMIEALRKKGIAGYCADVQNLSLNERFSVILAAGLLEFLDDPARFFQVAERHSNPSSRLVLLVPRGGLVGLSYRIWHASHGVSVRLWTTRELISSAQAWRFERGLSAGPMARVLCFRRTGGDLG